MSGDPYVYPDAPSILKNKFGIKNADRLDSAERRAVAQRIEEGVPSGNFDLEHLRAIHRHLFQDVYTWAGETRTVEIAKDGDQFHLMAYIETGMADIHGRLPRRPANKLRIDAPSDRGRVERLDRLVNSPQRGRHLCRTKSDLVGAGHIECASPIVEPNA